MRTLLAGLAGGAILFVWGAVSHMATPLGNMGFGTIAEAAEPALLTAMKSAMTERRIYIVPGFDFENPTDAAKKAWMEKVEAGPVAWVAYYPGPGTMMDPMQLATEFVFNVLEGLILAFIVARLSPGAGYGTRVLVCFLAGIAAAVAIDGSYWNWYHFPTAFFLAQLVGTPVGSLLAGLAVAKIVRPAA